MWLIIIKFEWIRWKLKGIIGITFENYWRLKNLIEWNLRKFMSIIIVNLRTI
jgi:hypothetical protein